MNKELIEKRIGLKLKDITAKDIKQFGGHRIGKKYYCDYWGQTYEVLDIKPDDIFGWKVVCKWQDGHVNEHSTMLRPGKDFEVIR